MYGLLIENLAEYIRVTYGDEKWEEVRRLAHIDMPTFSTRRVYSDSLIPRLAHKATKVLGTTEKEFFEAMGVFFIEFVGQYGYDRVMSVLGRHMRDFLNGLDNLHEYLKFSYPRMKAPSFICENENEHGLTLHYRSKRQGYVYYTIGQIKAVGRHFYSTDVRIELIHEELQMDTVHVTFQLYFENTAYLEMNRALQPMDKLFPVQPSLFLDIFPFSVVFGNDMIISNIGHSLEVVMPNLLGSNITDAFNLNRPLIDFTWGTVLIRTNNIFELVTMEPLHRSRSYELLMKAKMAEEGIESGDEELDILDDDNFSSCLSLKGQMLYMDDWKSIIFLGTPIMQDLESLMKVGLYINDLSMHDFSRDLMLAGTQQSVELKLALDQEQQKSKRLEDSMKKLDDEMRRTDELLYQMIPKAVADRLRKGAEAVTTCEVFDCVTILFSDVVTFTQICSRITPMEVVSLLNSMYSVFDQLTSKHEVYKVETIGDAYMVVSGAPDKRRNHADKICSMALDMRTGIEGIRDPSTGINISIRIGIHSGTVVAGVVGLKMPRYCLFGDTVNTASRMESTSEAMKIHVSESTAELLHRELYEMVERGIVTVKGKGEMKTYFLIQRLGPLVNFSDDEIIADTSATVRKISSPVDVPNRDSSPEDRFSPGMRSLYSPVMQEDVFRHQMASPFRQHANSWNGTNQPGAPPPAAPAQLQLQPVPSGRAPAAANVVVQPPPAAPASQAQPGGAKSSKEATGGWVSKPVAIPVPAPAAPPPGPPPPDIKKVTPASSQQQPPRKQEQPRQQPDQYEYQTRRDDRQRIQEDRPAERKRQDQQQANDQRTKEASQRETDQRDRKATAPQQQQQEETKKPDQLAIDPRDREVGRRESVQRSRDDDVQQGPGNRDSWGDRNSRDGVRPEDSRPWDYDNRRMERTRSGRDPAEWDNRGRDRDGRWLDDYRDRMPDRVRWRDQQQLPEQYRQRRMPENESRYVGEWRRMSSSVRDQQRPLPERRSMPSMVGLFPCLNRMVTPVDSWRRSPRRLADGYDEADRKYNEDVEYRYVNSNSNMAAPPSDRVNGVKSTYCVML